MEEPPPAPDDRAVAIVTIDEKDTLTVVVQTSLMPPLASADNSGERMLLQEVLTGLHALLSQPEAERERWVASCLEAHAPLGRKKKLTVLSPRRDQAVLDSAGLPNFRRIPKADTDALLDEAGEWLEREFALPVGPIVDEDRRVEILNAVVGFHFKQLERELRTFSPAGLLEALVARYESFVRHEAILQQTLGARAAAFGATGQIEELSNALPETTQASVSLRFLIEYVSAQPPNGLRPLSLAAFDRLLAIAGQIYSRGLTSDVIHFKIESSDLSFLESGRLGLAQGTYQSGQRSFLNAYVPAYVEASQAMPTAAAPRTQAEREALVDELNDAFRAEWGYTMNELAEFHGALSDAAIARGSACAAAPSAELEEELAQDLGWTPERVREAIEMHTLSPRGSFIPAPRGFANSDLWPWRFNRALSYLRRPIVRRLGVNGPEYVWGVRQPAKTSRFVFDLVSSERLKAKTEPMKQLMTKLRQREALAFVAKVEAVLQNVGMPTDTNVKKVGGERIRRANGQDLIDVDVLGADVNSRTIYALECKDLEGARTPAELHNELAHTFNESRSAATRHAERVAWLARRIPQTLTHLGITMTAKDWKVVGLLITDVRVISPYVKSCPLPVLPFIELRDRFKK